MRDCSQSEQAHRYVAGRLHDEELERFETHLLVCERCRMEVRSGTQIAAMQGVSAVDRRSPRRPARDSAIPPRQVAAVERIGVAPARRHRRLTWAISLPVAAITATLLLMVRVQPPDAGLSAFAPPVFSGGPSRADVVSSGVIDDGMRAYTSGDYGRAAELLERAADGDSSVPILFYLGVARMMSGDPAAALNAVRSVIPAAGSPYQQDAIVLAAKAWLRLGHVDSAVAVLRSGNGGTGRQKVGALLDSVLNRPP